MKRFIALIFLTCLLSSEYGMAADAIPPDPRIKVMVEELELQRSAEALRNNPRWQPQRIVVSLSAGIAQQMPELEALMRRSASGVELNCA